MHPSVFGQTVSHEKLESLFTGRASLARASFRDGRDSGGIEPTAGAFSKPTSLRQQHILCAWLTFAGPDPRRI